MSRSPNQVQLRRFLRGCLAATLDAEVVTGDRKDLRRLATATGKQIRLHQL